MELSEFRENLYAKRGPVKCERFELFPFDTAPYIPLMSKYATSTAPEWKALTKDLNPYYYHNYLMERAQALVLAGNPAEGSEEWRRIVRPTIAEYDERDRLAQEAYTLAYIETGRKASRMAEAFAALSKADMVALCPRALVIRESMWLQMTRLVPKDVIREVELAGLESWRLAEIDADEQDLMEARRRRADCHYFRE